MNRRSGILCLTGLSAFLLCGSTAPGTYKQNIGPSNGEVYGIAAGVAAGLMVGIIVLVEILKLHHQIKGCISTVLNGLEVENESGHALYTLTGASTSLKAGDIVKVKGNKEKQRKGVTAKRLFEVQKISRDYGPCKVPAAAPATQP